MIVLPELPAVTILGEIFSLPSPVSGVCVTVYVGDMVAVGLEVKVAVPVNVMVEVDVGNITFTCGCCENIPEGVESLGSLPTVNSAMPALPCATAPGPPSALLPYIIVMVPVSAVNPLAKTVITCPLL